MTDQNQWSERLRCAICGAVRSEDAPAKGLAPPCSHVQPALDLDAIEDALYRTSVAHFERFRSIGRQLLDAVKHRDEIIAESVEQEREHNESVKHLHAEIDRWIDAAKTAERRLAERDKRLSELKTEIEDEKRRSKISNEAASVHGAEMEREATLKHLRKLELFDAADQIERGLHWK